VEQVVRRARTIRRRRVASGTIVGLVAVAAIGVPLYAFTGLGSGPRPGGPSSGRGTLVAAQITRLNPGGPLYIEGAYAFLRVETDSGQLVGEVRDRYSERLHITLRLPAGHFRVAAYLRGCSAFCPNFGPPADPCQTAITIESGRTTMATATIIPTRSCTIRVVGPTKTASSPQLPDVAQVVCDGSTIEVLTPQIRPQPDGVHVQVDNTTDGELSVSVTYSTGGGVGGGASPGVSELDNALGGTGLPAPPGTTSIECFEALGGQGPHDVQPVTFEVLDEEGLYVPTALDCDQQVAGIGDYGVGAAGVVGDPVDLARAHFTGLRDTDIVERAGYPESTIPVVRVVRDGETIATVEYEPDGQGGWLQGTVRRCTDADIQG